MNDPKLITSAAINENIAGKKLAFGAMFIIIIYQTTLPAIIHPCMSVNS